MKRRKLYDFGTIRSKTMVLSKLAGGAIVLFYLVTEELPVGRELSFWIWFVLLIAVVGKADIKAAWQDQRHGGTDGGAGSYSALRYQYERRVRRTVEEPEYYVFEPSECAAKA